MTQQLRIIGGQYRRRVLSFAAIEGLRPTPDRVRETLFNWLMWDVQGAAVLDVCAGSGALAFEALSRGAGSALLIEPNRQQVDYLRRNAAQLKIENIEIIATTAQIALPQLTQAFDLIFLDPPYSLDLWLSLADLVLPLLKPHSKIYVEANRPLHTLGLPTDWSLDKQTKAGQVHAGLYTVL